MKYAHVTVPPSHIISVKIKYFIAALTNSGMSLDEVAECIDWAEGLMEIDAKMYTDERVMELARRF
jgi:hypothetical protein